MLLIPIFLNSQFQNFYAFQSKIRNPKSKIERHLKPNFGTEGRNVCLTRANRVMLKPT
jgi:hypothetical protein